MPQVDFNSFLFYFLCFSWNKNFLIMRHAMVYLVIHTQRSGKFLSAFFASTYSAAGPPFHIFHLLINLISFLQLETLKINKEKYYDLMKN